MSSTILGSILIFASCFVGTCNILTSMWVSFFLMGGVLLFSFFKNVCSLYVLLFLHGMVGVGIFP